MATYYVSATTGNDSNNGESVATAKATIGAGENLATSAGDIVYIAPGVYREKVAHGYSGTAANRIYFIGDPDCEIFGRAVPAGVVRVTGADANEFADDSSGTASGPIIRSLGKDYITWKNVHVDGNSSGINTYNDANTSYGFYASSESDHFEIINCMIQNVYYGTFNVSYVINCCSWNCVYGTYGGYKISKSFIAGFLAGCYNADLVQNSIIMAANYAAYNCNKVINCMIPNSYYGNYSSSGGTSDFIYDSIFGPNNYYAMGSPSSTSTRQTQISGSYCAGAYYLTRYGNLNGIGFGHVGYRQWISSTYDPYIGLGGSTDMTGEGIIFPQKAMTLWSINDIRKIAEGHRPSLYSKGLQGATSTVTDEDNTDSTDFFGNPRFMGSTLGMFMEDANYTTSSRDLGPFELTNVDITSSYATGSPGFTITDEGIFRIPISVSASNSVTASILVKHQAGSGTAVKPKFELRYSETNPTASETSTFTTTAANKYLSGSDLILQSVTQTAGDNTWETLTVSHSLAKDSHLELLFINQQTGSDSISLFSDLEIE